jgi:hypothetical protein
VYRPTHIECTLKWFVNIYYCREASSRVCSTLCTSMVGITHPLLLLRLLLLLLLPGLLASYMEAGRPVRCRCSNMGLLNSERQGRRSE